MRKATGLLALLRPGNAIMSSLGTLVGWLSGQGGLDLRLLVTLSVPALVLMGGNAINDYFDAEIDSVNKPHRPIPRGLVSLREALICYLLLSAFGSAVAIPLGLGPLLIAIFFSLAWFIYAYRLKATGLPGNALVSLGVGFTIPYGDLSASGAIGTPALVYASIALLANLARELIKAVEDLPGDQRVGLRTFPVRRGLNATRKLVGALLFTTGALTYLPILLKLLGFPFLLLGSLGVGVMAYVFPKVGYLDSESAPELSKAMKLVMALGLIGMLLDLAVSGAR